MSTITVGRRNLQTGAVLWQQVSALPSPASGCGCCLPAPAGSQPQGKTPWAPAPPHTCGLRAQYGGVCPDPESGLCGWRAAYHHAPVTPPPDRPRGPCSAGALFLLSCLMGPDSLPSSVPSLDPSHTLPSAPNRQNFGVPLLQMEPPTPHLSG